MCKYSLNSFIKLKATKVLTLDLNLGILTTSVLLFPKKIFILLIVYILALCPRHSYENQEGKNVV
jgi:hypothetical protein